MCSKKICQYTSHTGVIIANLFIREGEIIFYREASAMFGRSAPVTGRSRCKVINDRVRSCISNQIEVFIFVNDRNQILLRIPAVTKDDRYYLSISLSFFKILFLKLKIFLEDTCCSFAKSRMVIFLKYKESITFSSSSFSFRSA